MICPQCREKRQGTVCSDCLEFLVPADSLPDPAVTEPDRSDTAEPRAACPEPGCGEPLDAGRCPVHDLGAAPAALGLRFPWGVVSVGREPLRVGRSREFSELADRIARYDNVSRKHAELRQEGDRLTIEDIGSANGTYVNGARVASATAEVGDVVRFAADLEGTVVTRRPEEQA
jgi:hypothetical protein